MVKRKRGYKGEGEEEVWKCSSDGDVLDEVVIDVGKR